MYIYMCVCVYICFVSFCCGPFVLSSDFAMVLSLIVQARTETNVSMVPMKPWPHWCDWPVVVFCPSVTRYGGYGHLATWANMDKWVMPGFVALLMSQCFLINCGMGRYPIFRQTQTACWDRACYFLGGHMFDPNISLLVWW
jgi:hypothetical protein